MPLILLVMAMAWGAENNPAVFDMPAALTALLLFVAARTDSLAVPLPGWLAGLGTISYSLYLVHDPVLEVCTALWRRIDGPPPTAWIAAVATLGVCLLAAVLFHHAVERPSHGLARRLFRTQREAVAG